MARANILAFDITTGELDPAFDPVLNAQALTVVPSPDESRIYIGGSFTTVDGINRYRIAALDPVDGSLITGFNAVVDYEVNVLVATSDTVYAGGAFNYSGSATRSKLAAFSASNGALLAWAPTADATVHSMVLTPDGTKLIVGGKFSTLSGVPARASGALDPVTGAVLPWALNDVIYPFGERAAMLELSTDGTWIYGNAYHYGGAIDNTKWEGVFAADPDTGQIVMNNDCHGDTYAHHVMNGYVYSVSHYHYCGNLNGFPQSTPLEHPHAALDVDHHDGERHTPPRHLGVRELPGSAESLHRQLVARLGDRSLHERRDGRVGPSRATATTS